MDDSKLIGTGKYKIWYEEYRNDECIGAGVILKEYKYEKHAIRYAKKYFDNLNHNDITFKWYVSKTNPWEKGA